MALSSRLPFLSDVPAERAALFDDDCEDWLSYGELANLARDWQARLPGRKALIFLYARNDVATVAALLGAMAGGHAVALFDPALPAETRAQLEALYAPDWVAEPSSGRLDKAGSSGDVRDLIHPDLALLLSTSGSTGSPKLVRLTLSSMEANALAIAQVLAISDDDIAAAYLPLHYSYGLSVLTSHLARGAAIRLTEHGVTDRPFWSALRGAQITHLPGVPFHVKIMLRLGMKRIDLPSLKSLTQAGGALDVEARREAHAFMDSVGGRFYVMYGQTEAAPRMTTLQHDSFESAPASVGTALPGCRIEIVEANEDGEGEVVFYGSNVMMGYAEKRDDLALGDEQQGRLLTGDIGRLDDGDRLTLTGRAKRFGKVYGLRVNLDELELRASAYGDAAVTQSGDLIFIHLVATGADDETREEMLLGHLTAHFTLPRSVYSFRRVSHIPRTERGKVDYAALEAVS